MDGLRDHHPAAVEVEILTLLAGHQVTDVQHQRWLGPVKALRTGGLEWPVVRSVGPPLRSSGSAP